MPAAAPTLELDLHPERLAIVQVDAADGVPSWALEGAGLAAIVRRGAELTVVRAEQGVPAGVRAELGWRALEVRGPLDFASTGILASLAALLAEAGVTIFALSTYDTDVVLVRDRELDRACTALVAAGHAVFGPDTAVSRFSRR